MAQQVWPSDELGNEIRIGKLMRMGLPEAAGMFYVMGVRPASVILDGEGGKIPVNGEIEVAMKFKIPFAPDRAQMSKVLVIEQPPIAELSNGTH